MFPPSMPRLVLRPEDSLPDPSHALEQHVLSGFPPDLALDLVLNELVIRAAEATRASAAALALVRGNENEMVCRAATGQLAPGLGIPLKPRDGLSGACLQTRKPQLSVDTEHDARVDPDISRRLGIRSILAVPIFETSNGFDISKNAKFTGVLEVFSTSSSAFSNSDQKLLEAFANECARVRQAALELGQRKPVGVASTIRILPALVPAELTPSDVTPPDFTTPPDFAAAAPAADNRSPSQVWALVLGALTILAAIALSFLIGSRIGWIRTTPPASRHIEQASSSEQVSSSAATPQANQSLSERSMPEKALAEKAPAKAAEKARGKAAEKASRQSSPTPEAAAGELVVYEKGKVIFRTKATPGKQINDAVNEATSTAKLAPTTSAPTPSVWLDPEQAEARLQRRTEPEYPPTAVAAHRVGDVVLEVQVAEDGSVVHIRLLRGDPVLAGAAAEAVRTWRYQPYLQHDHPSQFQTDVTLTFALPN